MKKAAFLLLMAAIATAFTLVGNRTVSMREELAYDIDFVSARVMSVEKVTENSPLDVFSPTPEESKRVHFTARFSAGELKGTRFYGTQDIDYVLANPPRQVRPGDRIVVTFFMGADIEEYGWIYVEHDRSIALIVLVGLFFLLIIAIGRMKGAATILALGSSAAAIFLVYLPAILNGRNIYATTAVISAYIIFISLTTINGFNRKTLCAILGNAGGVVVAALLALLVNKALGITGFVNEDFTMLIYLDRATPLDLRALVWAGIVIGSLGAVMDVAMTIASSMNELSEHMSEKSFARLLASGMNIGRDAIGTMTNTLILAYIGSALAMVLLLAEYNKNLLFLFNMEMITVEIVQAVVGTMGILFAVPSTAMFAAYIYNRKNQGMPERTGATSKL